MKNNKLITYETAVKIIDENVLKSKHISLPFEKCTGLILAQSITANIDIPAFTNSAMDGYAVISADLADASKTNPVKLEIIGTIAAGAQLTKNVDCGKCIAIMTGAPLPKGADAVVKIEDTECDGEIITFFSPIQKKENIRFKGEEAGKGDPLVPANSIITPGVIGLASSLGKTKLEVYAPPKIAIIITGDEVLPPGDDFQEGKIIDATGPALKSALLSDNFPISFFEYAKDNPVELDKTIKRALSSADVILIAGGASMGEFDFVQDCLEKNRVKKIFWKVAVKPGKPIWFGKLNKKLIFNLPGNPVSVIVTYYLYVRFALRRMIGYNLVASGLKKSIAKLSGTITKTNSRLEFVRGIVDEDNFVTPLKQRGSAMLSGMAIANCLINFPRNCNKIEKGKTVEIFILNG